MGHGMGECCCGGVNCSTGITASVHRCGLLSSSVGILVSTATFGGPCAGNSVSLCLCHPMGGGVYVGTSGGVTVTVTVAEAMFGFPTSGLHQIDSYQFVGPAGTIVLTRVGSDWLMSGCALCPFILAQTSYEHTQIRWQVSGVTYPCPGEPFYSGQAAWHNEPALATASGGCHFTENHPASLALKDLFASPGAVGVIHHVGPGNFNGIFTETAPLSRVFTLTGFNSPAACNCVTVPSACLDASSSSVAWISEAWVP